MTQRNRSYNSYGIGIICALAVEMAAVEAMLDEEHPGLSKVAGDENEYTLGRVGAHNVAVACLPAGMRGKASAARVARDMMRSFPIKIGLMVGVGGGVWSENADMRLGDVVVSQPKIHGGVVQWDYGKMEKEGIFVRTGVLDKPPIVLLNALQKLQTRHKKKQGNTLSTHLSKVVSELADEYQYQGAENDHLFEANYNHVSGTTCVGCDNTKLVNRLKERKDNIPRIFYGDIASGDEVMKDGATRDRIASQEQVICFEMEAAGLMDSFPCVVVRGICDYADSHKNERWQPYAAATAAAYTKELLAVIGQQGVDELKPVTAMLPLLHTFPFPQNKDVVIRKKIFSALNELLPETPTYQRAVLWGLGGCGKTQIALEFAYQRHTKLHWPVFWIHADGYDKFLQGYRLIAAKAHLSSDLQGDDLMTAVRLWLEGQQKWLLVIDNADDLRHFGLNPRQTRPEKVQNLCSFIPCGSSGSILWTTRDERAVGHLAGLRQGIDVTGMSDVEATELLTNLSGYDITADNKSTVTAILDHLDYLPLATSQAGSYLHETRRSFNEYLDRLHREKRRWRLLAEEGPSHYRQENVPNSVMDTWRITMDHLNRECPLAHWLLQVVTHFHNQYIPWSIIMAAGQAKRVGAIVESTRDGSRGHIKMCDIQGNSEHDVDSKSDDSSGSENEDDHIRVALTRLMQFSFLRPSACQGDFRTYDIHKLVQDATRYHMRQETKNRNIPSTANTALQVLTQAFPSGNYGTWDECERLLSHALAVCRWPEVEDQKSTVSHLLSRASLYLWYQGRSREAEEIDVQVLQLQKEVLGGKHPDTITSMANLAATYYQQGRLREAEEIVIQVLQLRKEVLGGKHPDTITSMADLAATYYQQGRSREAKEINIQVLQLRKEVLGGKHPDTITSMANLAATYYQQGRSREAKEIIIQVLQLRKEVLGEKYPATIASMADLAATYYQQGRSREAEEIIIQVLQLRKEVLGGKHPNTITSMANLAVIYIQQGRSREAEELNVQVLQLRKEVLGEKHPATIASMANLAAIYIQQGRSREAEEIDIQVLQLRKEVLGEDHPDTLESKRLLAHVSKGT